MKPGTIMVCPPAWTQLFAHAIGLVTDIGSILAHGSIVAREWHSDRAGHRQLHAAAKE